MLVKFFRIISGLDLISVLSRLEFHLYQFIRILYNIPKKTKTKSFLQMSSPEPPPIHSRCWRKPVYKKKFTPTSTYLEDIVVHFNCNQITSTRKPKVSRKRSNDLETESSGDISC